MNRTLRGVASALAVAALVASAGCKENTGPKSGLVYVALSGGTSPARSVQVRLVGRQAGIAVASGASARIFTGSPSGDTIAVAVIAPIGQALTGALLQVTVPDLDVAVSTYQVTLLQVAAADYSLQNPSAYAVKVRQSPN